MNNEITPLQSIEKPPITLSEQDLESLKSLPNETSLNPLEEIDEEDVKALLRTTKKFPNIISQQYSSTQPYTGNIGNAIKPDKLPIEGRISQEYGVPVDYEASKKHGGVDIAVPAGTPVPEVAGGEVLEAGNNGAWGNTVLIKGNDEITRRYSHLSEINVKKGQTIDGGVIVGKVGSTGRSSGNHLDFRTYSQ